MLAFFLGLRKRQLKKCLEGELENPYPLAASLANPTKKSGSKWPQEGELGIMAQLWRRVQSAIGG